MCTISLVEKDEQRLKAAFLQERFYTLQRLSISENHIQLFVSLLPYQSKTDSRLIFGMDYKKDVETGKKYRKIFKITKFADEVLWKTELDQSTNLSELSQSHLFKLKHFYKKTFDERPRNGSYLEDETDDSWTLEMLKYIETLEIDDTPCGIPGDSCFYRRRQEPLSNLATIHKNIKQFFVVKNDDNVTFTPIFQTKHFIYTPRSGYNMSDFLKHRSARTYLHIGLLTPENIVDFIQSWQVGKIRKNFEWCVWNMTDLKFDKCKLWNLLSGCENTSEPIEFEQHKKKNGRIARLHCTDTELRFFSDKKPKVANEKSFNFSRLSEKIQNVSKTLVKFSLSEKSEKIKTAG